VSKVQSDLAFQLIKSKECSKVTHHAWRQKTKLT